jgi:hypothetical protein
MRCVKNNFSSSSRPCYGCLQNARRGGSTDALERSQLGAEAAALIGFLGPEKLPLNWASRIGEMTDEEMHAFVDDPSKQEFQRKAMEVQLALNVTTEEIRSLLEKRI